jgi:acetylornithine deacetylase/succinyl-diaminopimelate desuccinylase-like protein
MQETTTPSAFHTVTQLAGRTAIHRAFQWFHLQEPKLREWHREIASIPAPSFQESARAQWLAERFHVLGLEDVHIDACGNTLGWLRGTRAANLPCTLVSAHLDTVFLASEPHTPRQEGTRMLGPSVSDNCAGIVALLAIAAAMQSADLRPAADILFAGNVGEEGEGNLRGMRYLFMESPGAQRIRSAVILDGAGTESIVTQALGSKRFRITITGPGGHSWTDAGTPNAILVLAEALAAMAQIELHASPRTTWNIGHIEGGTAINAIPQQAQARIDTRSTDQDQLRILEEKIRGAVEEAVARANRPVENSRRPPTVHFEIETIGERPAATLNDHAYILAALRAVDRHLGIRSQPRIASTDANVPLSLGVEAVSIGSGGTGGGVHTPQEWFDPTGRDLALRRILLLLLTMAQQEM